MHLVTRRCVRRRAPYDGRDPGGDRRSDCRGVITKKIRKEEVFTVTTTELQLPQAALEQAGVQMNWTRAHSDTGNTGTLELGLERPAGTSMMSNSERGGKPAH